MIARGHGRRKAGRRYRVNARAGRRAAEASREPGSRAILEGQAPRWLVARARRWRVGGGDWEGLTGVAYRDTQLHGAGFGIGVRSEENRRM